MVVFMGSHYTMIPDRDDREKWDEKIDGAHLTFTVFIDQFPPYRLLYYPWRQ